MNDSPWSLATPDHDFVPGVHECPPDPTGRYGFGNCIYCGVEGATALLGDITCQQSPCVHCGVAHGAVPDRLGQRRRDRLDGLFKAAVRDQGATQLAGVPSGQLADRPLAFNDLSPEVQARLQAKQGPFAAGQDEAARYDSAGNYLGDMFYDADGTPYLHPKGGGDAIRITTSPRGADLGSQADVNLRVTKSTKDAIRSAAIPAEAIPSNAIPAEGVAIRAIPAEAIPAEASSNAIPAEAIPAEAIPSNAIPAEAIPAEAIPAEAIPSNAIPSNAIPAEAIPAEAIPSNAIPAEATSAAMLKLMRQERRENSRGR